MTNHWNQSRSTFRKGEPEDHKQAKNLISKILDDAGYTVHKEYPLVDSLVPNYRHNYDIVAFGEVMVVEIDDPNLHSKPQKKANDKRAESHARANFKGLDFIRLDKNEVNNPNKSEFVDYIERYLWGVKEGL